MHSPRLAGALCVALVAALPSARAESPPCNPPFDRSSVVRCALTRSAELKQAEAELAATRARRIAAGLWLPSNPTFELYAAGRFVEHRSAFNPGVALSQEVELGGQRGARLGVVDAEVAAQERRVAATRREVAANALRAYFDLLAARELAAFGQELDAQSSLLERLIESRARSELLSPVDARLARAEAIQLRRGALSATASGRRASAALAALLGLPVTEVEVRGELAALPAPPGDVDALVARALRVRGDVAAAEAERTVLARREELLRRERVPNATFSFFLERDGIAETVVGGTLGLPMPLPAPVGHSNEGEIAEVQAQAVAAEAELEDVRRRVRGEVLDAANEAASSAAQLDVFPPSLVAQAHEDLRALTERVSQGQVAVGAALAMQRVLVDLIREYLDTQHAAALASVELARAAGLELPGEQP